MAEFQLKMAELMPFDNSTWGGKLGGLLAIVVLVFFIYWWFARVLSTLLTRGGLSEQTHAMLRRISWWVACLMAMLMILQQFGMLENAWATLTAVVAMVAIGFVAVWSVLSNALCSIILMVSRPFNVGDTIEITGDGVCGKVIDFNLIFTTLRDGEDSTLQVPNNTFFQKPIRRQEGKRTRTLDQQVDRDKPLE